MENINARHILNTMFKEVSSFENYRSENLDGLREFASYSKSSVEEKETLVKFFLPYNPEDNSFVLVPTLKLSYQVGSSEDESYFDFEKTTSLDEKIAQFICAIKFHDGDSLFPNIENTIERSNKKIASFNAFLVDNNLNDYQINLLKIPLNFSNQINTFQNFINSTPVPLNFSDEFIENYNEDLNILSNIFIPLKGIGLNFMNKDISQSIDDKQLEAFTKIFDLYYSKFQLVEDFHEKSQAAVEKDNEKLLDRLCGSDLQFLLLSSHINKDNNSNKNKPSPLKKI